MPFDMNLSPFIILIVILILWISCFIGICLDTFSDGDELRPLPCSHCFHRACVDEWLLGVKSDERTFTNNCPCCRQDISPCCSSGLMPLSIFTCPILEEVTS